MYCSPVYGIEKMVEIVYESAENDFLVYTDHGRLYLCNNIEYAKSIDPNEWYRCCKSAELINGYSGLDKQYKGSFEHWYKSIQKKKLKTYNSFLDQASALQEQADVLKRDWNLESLK